MEYTVQKLARMSGVSPRTLRYYDGIGLLKPARFSPSGYRLYGPEQVDMLQQILFYRELGVGLDDIRQILKSPEFDRLAALNRHRERLLEERARLDILIANVDRTLADAKGEGTMSDQEKFEGFKQKLLDENERQYGAEIREKYGEDAVERSNRKVRGMTEQQYNEVEKLGEALKETLLAAYKTGDPGGELAQKAADLHRRWLTFYWDGYSKEAHAGLAQMVVDDPRFRAYYDKDQPGLAAFLRDAVRIYTKL